MLSHVQAQDAPRKSQAKKHPNHATIRISCVSQPRYENYLMGSRAAVLAAFVFCSVTATAAPPADNIRLPGYTRVQLTRGPQNHLVLRATVNGQPATFLVDTGTSISFVRSDRARTFGVRVGGEQTRRAGRMFSVGVISGLVAGGTPLGEMPVALTEGREFRGTLSGGAAADGVIGLDLLRRQKAVINCRTRQIFFKTDPSARLNLVEITRALGFTRISLDESQRGDLTVACAIRGRTGKLVVDTGAFVTSFDDNVARSLGLVGQPSKLTARGFDGRVRPLELARIDGLRIGWVSIAPQPFAVIDLFGKKKEARTYTGMGRIEYYPQRARDKQLFGVLGNELLDQRRAIIDLDSMTLYLK